MASQQDTNGASSMEIKKQTRGQRLSKKKKDLQEPAQTGEPGVIWLDKVVSSSKKTVNSSRTLKGKPTRDYTSAQQKKKRSASAVVHKTAAMTDRVPPSSTTEAALGSGSGSGLPRVEVEEHTAEQELAEYDHFCEQLASNLKVPVPTKTFIVVTTVTMWFMNFAALYEFGKLHVSYRASTEMRFCACRLRSN